MTTTHRVIAEHEVAQEGLKLFETRAFIDFLLIFH
jgi:hypothetical protein